MQTGLARTSRKPPPQRRQHTIVIGGPDWLTSGVSSGSHIKSMIGSNNLFSTKSPPSLYGIVCESRDSEIRYI